MKVSELSPSAKDILAKALKSRYEDYKERLVGSNDDLLRGRAQELRSLIDELSPSIDSED